MRLKFSFSSDKSIFLPKGYFSTLQGLIYNMLDRVSAEWLHSKGFIHNRKPFKLFVFSEINEKGEFLKDKGFLFPSRISFYLDSPFSGLLEQIAKNAVNKMEFTLGHNKIKLESISPVASTYRGETEITVKTLSPVEVHTSIPGGNGSYFTNYHTPFDSKFSLLIERNLKSKWEILNGKKCPHGLKIRPADVRYLKQRVLIVKNTVIKGWKGRFVLNGHPELIELALKVGLGTRNSLGFGMIECLRER